MSRAIAIPTLLLLLTVTTIASSAAGISNHDLSSVEDKESANYQQLDGTTNSNTHLRRSLTVASDLTATTTKAVGFESSVSRTEVDPTVTGLRFVMHVGPMKTGTTSLQAVVGTLAWHGKLHNDDNWYYPQSKHVVFSDGTVMEPNHAVFDYTWEQPDAFLDRLERDIVEFRKTNANILISHEIISGMFVTSDYYKRLKEIVVDKFGYSSLEIVAGYRPYYEYVRSIWYQGNHLEKAGMSDENRRERASWMNVYEPEKLALTRTMTEEIDAVEISRAQFTNNIMDNAGPHVTKVHVLPLHNKPTNYLDIFVCEILEARVSSCDRVRELLSEKKEVENKSSNMKIWADDVVLAARVNGWVDTDKYFRYDMMLDLYDYLTEKLGLLTSSDIPMDCSEFEESKKNEYLLQRTLDFDEQCLPEKYTTSDEKALRIQELTDTYQTHLDANLYCNIDTNELFKLYPDMVQYIQQNYQK